LSPIKREAASSERQPKTAAFVKTDGLAKAPEIERIRCSWAKDELSVVYHDLEWGVPQHDDRTLFEFIVLEGAQAGLSWSTILNKRENYRAAFDNFNAEKISMYGESKIQELLSNAGIVRNKLKIASAIQNAKAFLKIQAEFTSFDTYIWQFADKNPTEVRRRAMSSVPARTAESDAMSKDLLKRGFKFVGTTICYAFMQATGMVNDHDFNCFRYNEIG
jgi:DNA-3-methyladenine glycosylase I